LCPVAPVAVSELGAVDVEDDFASLAVDLDELAAFATVGVTEANQGVALTDGVTATDDVGEVALTERLTKAPGLFDRALELVDFDDFTGGPLLGLLGLAPRDRNVVVVVLQVDRITGRLVRVQQHDGVLTTAVPEVFGRRL